MQLFEFLIWKDQPKKGTNSCKTGKYKGNLNSVISKISAIQNLLQPVIYGIIILSLVPKKNLSVNSNIIIVSIVLYMIALIVWIMKTNLISKKLCTKPCKDECDNHHLQWQWVKDKFSGKLMWILYFSLLAFMLFCTIKNTGGLILAVFLVISCLLSLTVYPLRKAAGSWWCLLAVLGPILKFLIPAHIM